MAERIDILLQWLSNISPVIADVQILEQNFAKLQQRLTNLGQGGDLQELLNLRQGFERFAKPILNDLKRIREELVQLGFEQVKLDKAGRSWWEGGKGARRIPAGLPGAGRFGTQDQVDEALEARRAALRKEQEDHLERMAFLEEHAAASAGRMAVGVTELTERREVSLARAHQITKAGGELDLSLARRREEIDKRINALQEHRATLITGSLAQTRPIQEVLKLQKDLLAHERQEERLQQSLLALREGNAAAAKRLAQSQSRVSREALAAAGSGRDIEIHDLVGARDIDAAKEFNRTRKESLRIEQQLRVVSANKDALNQIIASSVALRGLTPALNEIDAQLEQLGIEFNNTFNLNALEALENMKPGLGEMVKALEAARHALANTAPESADYAKHLQNISRLTHVVSKDLKDLGGGADLPPFLSPEAMREQALKEMPLFEQTMIQAFTGFRRRFIATLQFAISGTLLFGTQRLAREFLQTAIEVERAFADIGTAFEFDIEAERGTAQFKSQLEGVRREILNVANALNVLPTEANEAAFLMVSRFRDVDNALKATRALLLATKVSTIDQSEILRALTAVAETFASATLETNDALSLQERLLQRESIAAELYGEALDKAVIIQQRFGPSVEDTLEGTAALAEVYRQLGFSLEETMAMVSLVSFETGQTGAQAAERLARSLGQIDAPQVRDQLLSLAAASEHFALSLSDFENGATAWRVIADQITRLEDVDPSAVRRIIQIIGQRREVAVVAAALGTADIQSEVVRAADSSADAAANRYKFLQNTIVELLKSISARFQELAQNVERLGLLSPLKLFIQALDSTLSLINAIARGLISIKEALNFIPIDFMGLSGLGDVVFTLFSLNLALRTTQRLLVGLTKTTATLARAELATGIVGGPLSRIAPRIATTSAVASRVPSLGTLSTGVLTAVPGGKAVITTFSRIAAVGAGTIGTVVALGAAMASATVGFFKMRSALRAFEDLQLPDRVFERQLREEGGTEAEQKLKRAENQLSRLAVVAEKVPQGFSGALNRANMELDLIGGNLIDIVTLQKSVFDVFPSREQREQFGGMPDWWRVQQEQFRKEFLQAGLDVIQEDMQAAGGVDFRFREGISRIRGLLESADSTEDLDAIEALMFALEGSWEDMLRRLLRHPTQLEGTLADLQNEMQNLPTRGRLEGLSLSAQVDIARRIAGDIDNLIGQAGDNQELKNEMVDAARAQRVKILDLIDEVLAQDLALIDALASTEQGRLDQRVVRLTQGFVELANELDKEEGGFSSEHPAVIQSKIDLNEATREAAVNIENTAQELAQQRISLAVTTQDWVRAQKLLIAQIAVAIVSATLADDLDAVAELSFRSATIAAEIAARAFDDAQRSIVAQTRLGGPIGSRLFGIQGEIRALEHGLASGRLGDTEKLEATLSIRELLAERARLELERTGAFLRLQAGTRNQLLSLQTELEILGQELELTANQFGKNSQEWFEVSLKIAQTEASLMDAGLRLKDVNRRLEGDLTNAFLQAQNDLIAILDQLALGDLGELEKAQLELQRRQSEAQLERAFFNDKLFALDFGFQTGELGLSAYITALRTLLEQVDTTTQQGKEIFLQISNLIEGLVGSISDLAFNIPSQIRLPTLFEIRRAVQGEQLGITYQDNRQQNIVLNVSDAVDLSAALGAIEKVLGVRVSADARRSAVGRRLTVGGF